MKKVEIKKTLVDELGTWETYKNEILVDGQKVGIAFTMTDTENDDKTYLEDIVIDRDYRNKGYGTQAINLLAKKHGYLYFAPTDEDNQRLYERIAEEITTDAPEVDQGFGVYFIEK